MGVIFSRFRKKESTKEILGKIHDEITLLHEAKANTESSKRKLGLYIIYAWVLFIVASVTLYFYYAPSTLRDKLLSAIPPLIFIFMVFCTKHFFNYIYQWKLRKNDKKMKVLAEKKAKILDEVMETETYKVAKEILETYAPETLHKNMSLSVVPLQQRKQFQKPADSPSRVLGERAELITPQIRTPYVIKDSCSEVRRRIITSPGNGGNYSNMGQRKNQDVVPHSAFRSNIGSPKSANVGSAMTTPVRATPISQARLHNSPIVSDVPGGMIAPPGPPMPRPVLPRERGVFERFVEYLVGDGPSNRYALVCRQCESHNGMALKEEFEYLAFRCVYCYYWNPAKKQRPSAPKIANVPTLAFHLQQALQKNKSDSDKTSSGEDSGLDSAKVDTLAEIEEKKETEEQKETEEKKEPEPITLGAGSENEDKSSDEELVIEERSEEPKID